MGFVGYYHRFICRFWRLLSLYTPSWEVPQDRALWQSGLLSVRKLLNSWNRHYLGHLSWPMGISQSPLKFMCMLVLRVLVQSFPRNRMTKSVSLSMPTIIYLKTRGLTKTTVHFKLNLFGLKWLTHSSDCAKLGATEPRWIVQLDNYIFEIKRSSWVQ